MTFSTQQGLSISALIILIAINAIATGCTLAQKRAAEPTTVENVKAKPRKRNVRKPVAKTEKPVLKLSMVE